MMSMTRAYQALSRGRSVRAVLNIGMAPDQRPPTLVRVERPGSGDALALAAPDARGLSRQGIAQQTAPSCSMRTRASWMSREPGCMHCCTARTCKRRAGAQSL
ncbi:hypothetical protein [Metallibacterium scheffleri]